MDKSGNPALKKSALTRLGEIETTDYATVGGTISKVVILMAILITSAFFGWRMVDKESSLISIILLGSLVGSISLAFATIFVPKISPYTAPFYALFEGVLLGVISGALNAAYHGIIMQAVLLTFGVFVSVLVLYTTGIVKVTAKMRAVILIATLGIAIYYAIAFVASLFGGAVPLIYGSGTFGIIFSVVVIIVAALNLLLDFDFITQTARSKAPKVFEWYGAFSLVITIIWLYIEILRLLAKSRR